jgi:hypothetical protein
MSPFERSPQLEPQSTCYELNYKKVIKKNKVKSIQRSTISHGNRTEKFQTLINIKILTRRDHGDLMAVTCACRSCHTYENATLEEVCGGRGSATGDYCMSDYSGQSQPAPEEGWRNCYLGRGARVPAESSPLALSVGAC